MKDSYAFYTDKLNPEYKSVFDQVEMYVAMQNIDETTLEERLSDLLDIFLSAQEAGKPVQKIVGNNIEQFCKAFCSDFGVKNRILRILDGLKSTAWLFFVISVIDILFLIWDGAGTGELDIWHSASSLNISMYFIAVILFGALYFTINLALRSRMFKTKRVSMGVLKAVLCVEAVISGVGIFLLLTFGKISLFHAPSWLVALIAGVYLLIYYPLFGKRIKRQKVKFSELVPQTGVQTEVAAYMEKRFEKAKKKALKKGNGELTFEAFLDKEEQSSLRTQKLKRFYIVLPFVATALAYGIQYLIEEFPSVADSLIYIAVMLTVESLVVWGLWKMVKSGLKSRLVWIDAKRKELAQDTDAR